MPALGGLFSFKIPPPGGISYYTRKKDGWIFPAALYPDDLRHLRLCCFKSLKPCLRNRTAPFSP